MRYFFPYFGLFFLYLALGHSIPLHAVTSIKKPQLLLLHSSPSHSNWALNFQENFLKTLNTTPPHKELESDIKIEFLDAKNHDFPHFAPKLKQFLQEKYRNFSFDLVIAVGEEALEFSTELLPKIGKNGINTPLFFAGISPHHYSEYNSRHSKHIVGVLEEINYYDNMELMFSLFPNIKTIAFIHDGSKNSSIHYNNLESLFKADPRTHQRNLELTALTGPTEKELLTQIDQLNDNDTVIFYLGHYNFKFDSITKNSSHLISYLTTFRKLAVLTFWERYIHAGVLGGYMINSAKQGTSAAEIVLSFLNGKKYQEIEIKNDNTSQLHLNKKVYEACELDQKLIPKNTQFFNNEKTAFEIYFKEIIGTILLGVFLIILSIYLFVVILKNKKIERELSQSLQKYQTLVEKFPGALWIISNKKQLQYVSESFVKQYQNLYPEEASNYKKIPFERWVRIFEPNDRKKVEKALNDIFHKNIPISLRFRIRTFDKNHTEVLKWFECQASQIVKLNSDESAVIGVILDITERKNIEEKIIQAHHLESLGTLASGVAHDFNNILQGISIISENILTSNILDTLEVEQNQSIKQKIAEIINYQKRGHNLIKQILNFAGRHHSTKSQANLSLKSHEALEMARSLIPHCIKIESNIENDLWSELDDSKITQIIINLCNNAADSFHEKKDDVNPPLIKINIESIKLTSNPVLKDGDYIQITVSDNASGIPKEIIPKLINPFFTTKSARMRTGMGLSIIHGIVKMHHGLLTIESTEGLGTTITIHLPKIIPSTQIANIPPLANENVLQGKNILFVDDEAPILELTHESLKKLGVNIITALDGTEALQLFLEHPMYFDSIVTDQSMPHTTGLQLALEIRKHSKTIPIILTSGHISATLQKMKIDDPYFWILEKPYKLHELIKTLAAVANL